METENKNEWAELKETLLVLKCRAMKDFFNNMLLAIVVGNITSICIVLMASLVLFDFPSYDGKSIKEALNDKFLTTKLTKSTTETKDGHVELQKIEELSDIPIDFYNPFIAETIEKISTGKIIVCGFYGVPTLPHDGYEEAAVVGWHKFRRKPAYFFICPIELYEQAKEKLELLGVKRLPITQERLKEGDPRIQEIRERFSAD